MAALPKSIRQRTQRWRQACARWTQAPLLSRSPAVGRWLSRAAERISADRAAAWPYGPYPE